MRLFALLLPGIFIIHCMKKVLTLDEEITRMKKRAASMFPILFAILLGGSSFLFGCQKSTLISPETPLPDYPLGLSAVPISDGRTDLTWKTVPGAAGYRIYRDGNYITSSVMTSWADRKLKADTQYCYHVTAVDAGGKESGHSPQTCARTLPRAKPLLPAPEEIVGIALSETQNNISWKVVDGAMSYKIYRDGLSLAAARTSSLSDGGLKADTPYCYAVSAVDRDGAESELGKQVCVTTLSVRQQTVEKAAAMYAGGRTTIDVEFD
jgi:fibronectin type 3 domain-containing protein